MACSPQMVDAEQATQAPEGPPAERQENVLDEAAGDAASAQPSAEVPTPCIPSFEQYAIDTWLGTNAMIMCMH